MKLVLVVDDEAALLDVFAGVVEDLGHRVLTARDGMEALQLARSHLPDLIISDHMMPRLSGVEFLRAVRKDVALARTPFMLVSAANPKGADEATVQLLKPVALDAFEQSIAAALLHSKDREGEGWISPALPSKPTALIGGEMLAWVSHEIKSPLSAARMNVQLLARQLQEDQQPLRGRCNAVLEQLDRMNSLVNSVLDATRLSEGVIQLRPSPNELNTFVRSVTGYWQKSHPEVRFTLALSDEPLQLQLDEDRARNILDNLISNAVKYGDGRVDIRVDAAPGRAAVNVTDHGKGIDAAERPHLFERFHRADGSTGEGHGLGLYIAAASARLHGGSLTVRSERGEGSTFTLTLPRAH